MSLSEYRILSDFVDIYESNVATSNTYVTCLLYHTVRKGKRSDLIIKYKQKSAC